MPVTRTASSVLIVEDDDGSREALLRLLRRQGHDVIATPTAMAGIAAIIERQPRILLLDLMLPDVNGVEVLRVIRQHAWPILVAIVTAHHRPEQFPGLVELRPDKIFRKPINFDALDAWIAVAA